MTPTINGEKMTLGSRGWRWTTADQLREVHVEHATPGRRWVAELRFYGPAFGVVTRYEMRSARAAAAFAERILKAWEVEK